MNRIQIINKILHDHLDVNKYEDYTDYKKLIAAIEEWHDSEVKKLNIPDVSQQNELLLSAICQYTKRNTQKEIQDVERWIETCFKK